MTEWDQGTVFSAPQLVADRNVYDNIALSRDSSTRAARDFIRGFQRDDIFPYREALIQNYKNRQYFTELHLGDIKSYNANLHDAILKYPNEYIPMVEKGARDALISLQGDKTEEGLELPTIQVLFVGDLIPTQIRTISAADVNRLLLVPGIIISASRTKPKAVAVTIRCKSCGTERVFQCATGFGSITLPRTCNAQKEAAALENGGAAPISDLKCPMDPYVIITDKCAYVDMQTLKLQEAPETVPTGEMPRHMLLALERSLADHIAPGTRVSVLGVSSIFSSAGGRGSASSSGAVAIRTPYLRVVGVNIHEEGSGRAGTHFTPEDESAMRALAKEGGLYDRLASSIAPSIHGDYTTDIKKAILCLLMAGSRKLLPDGMRLRGDINVLMLGDPSTAKSQFLKFVEKVAPVGVYTSGKGSSAAGLTASVIRDAKGEFYLEGGAMVLADGGVVCIDEFDKMREEDRVAIHEAMEQQTISVAKAGITTILNSRAAVLAAANPVFGRYDDNRSAADNIDLLPTILSRFDMIFIVRDLRNEARDQEIARHVLRVHINAGAEAVEAEEGSAAAADISIATMKKFITFARNKCAPRLSDEAAKALANEYVAIRKQSRDSESQMREARMAGSEEHSVIPITVRQLEALVRITEAIAKVNLAVEATVDHVAEAIRLFRVSTLNAARSGLSSLPDNMTPAVKLAVQSVEKRINNMVPNGGSMSVSRLREQLLRAGFEDSAISTALVVMERRKEVVLTNERKTLRKGVNV